MEQESAWSWARARCVRYDMVCRWLASAPSPEDTRALMALLRERDDGEARWCWRAQPLSRELVALDERVGPLQRDPLEQVCVMGRRLHGVEGLVLVRLDTWGALGRVVWQRDASAALITWAVEVAARALSSWCAHTPSLLAELLSQRASAEWSVIDERWWDMALRGRYRAELARWDVDRFVWDVLEQPPEALPQLLLAQQARLGLALCELNPYEAALGVARAVALGHMARCAVGPIEAPRAARLLEVGERKFRALNLALATRLAPGAHVGCLTQHAPLRESGI